MTLTRAFAGLGLAALLTVTAACGSDTDSEKGAGDTKGSASSTEHTTATPEGASMIYIKAMSERDFTTVCEVTTDGEKPMGADAESLKSCVEMVEMIFTEEDEQAVQIIESAKTAVADGPSKVEELTDTTAAVSFAALNDGEPTGLTKIGDEWLVNLYG